MDVMKKMMEGLKITRTQLQGSEKVSNFDDVADAGGAVKHIAALCVRSGYIMDAIGVVDENGTKYLHGNPNGGAENYILLENEEIKNISGDIGVSFHGKAISNLTIEMKSGKKYGPFGTGKSGQHFCLTLPENTAFAGFYGNADKTIVKSLGLIGCEGDGEVFQKMMEQVTDGKLPKFGL